MFDLEKFRKADFKPREAEIEFSALAEAGFGDGKFTVRGLTATEIAQAEEAATRGKLVSQLVEKLAGSSGKDQVDALLEGVGISDDVPAQLTKRMEHVCLGSIKPKLELSDVVALANAYPIEFSQLANKVLELTGLGQEADVKP